MHVHYDVGVRRHACYTPMPSCMIHPYVIMHATPLCHHACYTPMSSCMLHPYAIMHASLAPPYHFTLSFHPSLPASYQSINQSNVWFACTHTHTHRHTDTHTHTHTIFFSPHSALPCDHMCDQICDSHDQAVPLTLPMHSLRSCHVGLNGD